MSTPLSMQIELPDTPEHTHTQGRANTRKKHILNMECSEFTAKYWHYSLASLLISILIITIVACSFHYVNYNEMTFIQNRFGTVDTTSVFKQGRYFLTLDKFFVTFPSTFQHVVYTTPVFTDIGLQFDLEVSFYYRLKPTKLGAMYNLYSKNYESRIINIAKTTIKNEAIQYTINDYIQKRQEIENKLGAVLQSTLDEMVGVEVPQIYFRLLTINMPNTLILTSLKSAINLQENQIQQYQQDVTIIQSDTQKMVSSINATSNQVIEYALTQADQIVKNSEFLLINQINTARSFGIQYLFNVLNITTDQLEFVKLLAYLDANNSKIIQTNTEVILHIN